MRRTTSRKYENRFVGRCLEAAVREYQREVGLEKQESVAAELGVTASQLSQWISGHAHPTGGGLEKIVRSLDIDRSELERLALVDKLDAWRRSRAVGAADMVEMAKKIRQAESANGEEKGEAAAA